MTETSKTRAADSSPQPRTDGASERITEVARASYGKLLAMLASRSGDIAAAEDALADAFARALEHWPKRGIPENPEAWLLTAARNRINDVFRSAAYRKNRSIDADDRAHDMADTSTMQDQNDIPDERLKLLFVCAHPAIDERIRTPLMLQTVLGLEAAEIAKAFIIPPATMAQRLVRAKTKIKQAAIPFVVPDTDEFSSRLDGVLEAIYGAFTLAAGRDVPDHGEALDGEAMFLADLVSRLMPREPEALGLAALIRFSMARKSHGDRFVPLAEQDPAIWDRTLIASAERMLRNARQMDRLGRFQLEAAIQAVHCDRAATGKTDWQAIVALYQGLNTFAPTIGSLTAMAAAVGEAFGPRAGLLRLAQLDEKQIATYQPFWATKAHLASRSGNTEEAMEAYRRAIALTSHAPVRSFLQEKLDRLLN